MPTRNFSPLQMFEALARENVPRYRFTGATPAEVAAWQAEAWPAVRATLGEFPGTVPPNAELIVEWEEDGLRKQRWHLDVQPHLSAALLVNIPLDLPAGERRPALLCWHGHGKFGKDAVMGNTSSPERREEIARHNYDYGRQMAQQGFVTYAIDWMGVGERNDSNKPHFRSHNGGRDWCNLYYLHATMLGTTSLAINVAHGMAATDFITTLPCVDGARLGVMGLSGGGTMTLWSALCDPRFAAAEIICYSDLWAIFGIRDLNYCGMQVAPGLYRLVDLPDLQGLLVPRPLLIDLAANDTCFHIDTAMDCYKQVEHIYQIAGAADRLELDLHPGEHGWGGNKSVPFFRKWLGVEQAAAIGG